MDTFDVSDENSWYFGSMSREEATKVLMDESAGIFLIRDSNSIAGDYVLCVREDTKVSNYIINKVSKNNKEFYYRIGDQNFENLPNLLTFYTLHYLDTTPLRRPAQKKNEVVITKFDFDGMDHDDLAFRRGEVLVVVRKDEDQWWTAKNARGKIGQIPVPYVEKYDGNTKIDEHGSILMNDRPRSIRQMGECSGGVCALEKDKNNLPLIEKGDLSMNKSDLNRKLPAYARVKKSRVPNAYDQTALKLELGDIIKVIKVNINGQWEGELNGKRGHFPFTHVEFITDCEIQPIRSDHENKHVDGHHITNNDWGE